MSFQHFNGYGGQARRDQDKVVVYLSPKQPVPDMVPYELHEYINPDDWHMRAITIRDTAFRYYKPLFERVWLVVATLSIIIVPLALYQVIFDAMYKDQIPHTAEHYYQARFVSMAVFVGTFLVFWVPVLVWKAIGKRRLRSVCANWEKADRAVKAPGTFVPVWTAKMPSVFKSTCILSIATPPNARPTLFHPNAYMPSYINPPLDAGERGAGGNGQAYFYPYAPAPAPGQHRNGLPRMSVAGALPAYSQNPFEPENENENEKDKERYFRDEKV